MSATLILKCISEGRCDLNGLNVETHPLSTDIDVQVLYSAFKEREGHMSRVVKKDFEPDLERVRTLLKRAIGPQPISKFATSASVNYSYLCQYLNGRFERSMAPNTLLRIAVASRNRITAEELLEASGYAADKYVKRRWYPEELDEEWDKGWEGLPTLEEMHQIAFLKKAAYHWYIKKKGFLTAAVQDDGSPFVLIRKGNEEWLVIFLTIRDGNVREKVQEGLNKFVSGDNRKLCIVVDDRRLCEREFEIPISGAEGLILCVDPYTEGVKPIGGRVV